MFAVGLSYMAFIMLRYVSSVPAFWRVFIINGCWILSKVYWVFLYWKVLDCFCVSWSDFCVNWSDHIVVLDVKSTLNSSDKSHLDVLIDLVGFYFVEDFCIYIHKGYWLECFLFYHFYIYVYNKFIFYNLGGKVCLNKNKHYPKTFLLLMLRLRWRTTSVN